MKRIRMFIITLLIIVSFSFMPPQVRATDITTETTTEETTEITTVYEETEEETAIDVEVIIDKAKTYIVGVALSLLSGGFLGTIAYIVLTNLKTKALEKLNEAVASNQISQSTADKATDMLNKGVEEIGNQIGLFEQNVLTKVNTLDNDVRLLVETINEKFVNNLKEALTEYFTEETE